jgi:hypothetical protein
MHLHCSKTYANYTVLKPSDTLSDSEMLQTLPRHCLPRPESHISIYSRTLFDGRHYAGVSTIRILKCYNPADVGRMITSPCQENSLQAAVDLTDNRGQLDYLVVSMGGKTNSATRGGCRWRRSGTRCASGAVRPAGDPLWVRFTVRLTVLLVRVTRPGPSYPFTRYWEPPMDKFNGSPSGRRNRRSSRHDFGKGLAKTNAMRS